MSAGGVCRRVSQRLCWTIRTPGYHAWQQPHWLYHCDDGAAYLGRVGWDQIQDDVGALQALHLEASELGLDDSQTKKIGSAA